MNQKCVACGRPLAAGAGRCPACGIRQSMPARTTFRPVSAERYRDMLEVLWPAAWEGGAFLVGEASDHRPCRVTGRVLADHAAFFQVGGRHFEASEALTRPEWERARLLAALAEGIAWGDHGPTPTPDRNGEPT